MHLKRNFLRMSYFAAISFVALVVIYFICLMNVALSVFPLLCKFSLSQRNVIPSPDKTYVLKLEQTNCGKSIPYSLITVETHLNSYSRVGKLVSDSEVIGFYNSNVEPEMLWIDNRTIQLCLPTDFKMVATHPFQLTIETSC